MTKATLKWNPKELRLESYEGAANVIHLHGPPVARVAHLALHRVDLEFARACLEVIEAASMEQWHTPAIEAAWRSALLHYCKCFAGQQGAAGRTQLSARKILGPEDGVRMKDHRLMMDLRNKHLVHDEGTHNWCDVAVLVAAPGATPKLLGIKVAAMDSVTLDHLTVASLRELVDAVHTWTVAEFERLSAGVADAIAATYSHSELLARETLGVGYPPKAKR